MYNLDNHFEVGDRVVLQHRGMIDELQVGSFNTYPEGTYAIVINVYLRGERNEILRVKFDDGYTHELFPCRFEYACYNGTALSPMERKILEMRERRKQLGYAF